MKNQIVKLSILYALLLVGNRGIHSTSSELKSNGIHTATAISNLINKNNNYSPELREAVLLYHNDVVKHTYNIDSQKAQTNLIDLINNPGKNILSHLNINTNESLIKRRLGVTTLTLLISKYGLLLLSKAFTRYYQSAVLNSFTPNHTVVSISEVTNNLYFAVNSLLTISLFIMIGIGSNDIYHFDGLYKKLVIFQFEALDSFISDLEIEKKVIAKNYRRKKIHKNEERANIETVIKT